MKSTFDGKCKSCGKPSKIGDEVNKTPSGTWCVDGMKCTGKATTPNIQTSEVSPPMAPNTNESRIRFAQDCVTGFFATLKGNKIELKDVPQEILYDCASKVFNTGIMQRV